MKRAALLVLLVCATIAAEAKVIGTNPPPRPLTRSRVKELPAAERAEWLSYLDRSAAQMRADKAALAEELKSAKLASPLPAPEGHSANSIPLDKDATWYGSADAVRLAQAIVSFQLPSGGWSKNIDMAHGPRALGESYAANDLSQHLGAADFDDPFDHHWNYMGTIDNDATITQMQYLARVITAMGPGQKANYARSFQRGLDYLLAAQYPNGGWPQVWPLEGGYHDAITLNDDAMTQVLELLADVAYGHENFGFADDSERKRARTALDKGVRNLLRLQINANGHKTVWAQQYDALTLEPCAARNFEMPAASSAESAIVVRFLMSLPQQSDEIRAAITAAVAWFERTAIRDHVWRSQNGVRSFLPEPGAEPIWARYYQIGTDLPIFGDRDKTIHDDVSEISTERRNGYAWYDQRPQRVLNKYPAWKQQHELK